MKKILYILFSTYFCIFEVQAKWAPLDNAAAKIEFSNSIININKDGTSEEIIEVQYHILKEQWRELAGNFKLFYDGDSEELKLIEVKTITKGQEYPVDLKLIEDQPLASSHKGFDQYRQLLIAFPNVVIGSKIYLKYTKKVNKTILDNFFSKGYYWGQGLISENEKVYINSKLPLKIEKNDPNSAIIISENFIEKDKEKIQIINISNNKPIYHEVIDEFSSLINANKFSWIVVSSLDKRDDFALEFSKGYMSAINQALPESFKIIQNLASKEQSDIDRINKVTSLLNEKVQYMGDWRSVDGRFFPRDLSIIASTQIGDCKDFSAATAAILNNMGYRARAALVMRGIYDPSFDTQLPLAMNFNHAMVKVVSNKGKIYWIDPTNTISMAGGIFNDIEGKKAIILDEDKPVYETIDKIDPSKSNRSIVEIIELKGEDIFVSGFFDLKGESASILTAAELYLSKDNLKDKLFYYISETFLKNSQKLDMNVPDLKSRIVSDLSFSYKYKQKHKLFTTNLGKGYSFKLDTSLKNIIRTSDNQVSDILISDDNTRSFSHVIFFKGAKAKFLDNLNVKIDTKWVKISRKAIDKQQGVEISTDIVIKDNIISSDSLNSLEYKELKLFIEEYFEGAAVIF